MYAGAVRGVRTGLLFKSEVSYRYHLSQMTDL